MSFYIQQVSETVAMSTVCGIYCPLEGVGLHGHVHL